MVEPVFDGPVLTGERHDPLGTGGLGWQAGDQVDDLDGLALADAPAPLEPGDLRQAGPVEMVDRLGRERDAAGLDPAVALFDGFSLGQVRRRDGRGGNRRRRRPRCRAAAPAGWPSR